MTPHDAFRERVRFYLAAGFRVVSETGSTAQLVKPRRFNPVEFIAMPIYLLEYLTQRDRTIYLEQLPDGRITETGSGVKSSRYRRVQEMSVGARIAIAVWVLVVVFAVLISIRTIAAA